jgi:hypothetical protein
MILWLLLLVIAIAGILWALNADGHVTKWRTRKKKQERSIYSRCSMCAHENMLGKVWLQQAAGRYKLSEAIRDTSCDECGADLSADLLKHPFVKELHGRIAQHRMQKLIADETLNLSAEEEDVMKEYSSPGKVKS